MPFCLAIISKISINTPFHTHFISIIVATNPFMLVVAVCVSTYTAVPDADVCKILIRIFTFVLATTELDEFLKTA